MRDLKPLPKPTISTEATVRDIGKDRTQTVVDVGSQRATAQPEVQFATSKPPMTLMAGQSWVPPTNGGNPSSAFQVPQLANTQMQYLPSQGPNIVTNARDDHFIRSSLPKLKLAEFSGDPLEWPEWSQLFQATVHAANMDDSVKKNHLKTMVTGKAKEAIADLGYSAEMYNVAWNILVRNFGKPQMVVNAQLKRIYSFPPMKPDDVAALIKCARIVSSCVNVLTQFNYTGDLNSEKVLGSATRKLTLDMKTKWLTYVKRMHLYQPGTRCVQWMAKWYSRSARWTAYVFKPERWSCKNELQGKGPKALPLPPLQQTQQMTTRKLSESVCWKMVNIQYGNVRSSRKWTSKREDKRQKNWSCASNACQTHIRWEIALVDFAT